MFEKWRGVEIYIMRHSMGYKYHLEWYRYGEFSVNFDTKDECLTAAREEIEGKRNKYGIARVQD